MVTALARRKDGTTIVVLGLSVVNVHGPEAGEPQARSSGPSAKCRGRPPLALEALEPAPSPPGEVIYVGRGRPLLDACGLPRLNSSHHIL
jgi:hypothetical protein